MKRIIPALLALVVFPMSLCAQNNRNMNKENSKRILVAYFSATGTTERAAKTLAAATGGELFEIAPVPRYTSADLNWHDRNSRSSLEMADPLCRPEIKAVKTNISDYDIVFVGYPIWWNLAPRQVYTFLDKHDLAGKLVIPFATSGGSSIGGSVADLRKVYPKLNWDNGRLLNRIDAKGARAWFDSIHD